MSRFVLRYSAENTPDLDAAERAVAKAGAIVIDRSPMMLLINGDVASQKQIASALSGWQLISEVMTPRPNPPRPPKPHIG